MKSSMIPFAFLILTGILREGHGELRRDKASLPESMMKVEVFPTLGIGLVEVNAGVDLRFNSRIDLGIRAGALPIVVDEYRSYSGHIILHREMSNSSGPRSKFFGTELVYREERSSGSYFETVAWNLFLGREYHLGHRIHFSYAYGGGYLHLVQFKGGGASMALPISLMGRAEFRFQLF